MSADGHRTKGRRNIAENFNRLSRVHERCRQTVRQTDDRWTDDDTREREFTFAKNVAGGLLFWKYTIHYRKLAFL